MTPLRAHDQVLSHHGEVARPATRVDGRPVRQFALRSDVEDGDDIGAPDRYEQEVSRVAVHEVHMGGVDGVACALRRQGGRVLRNDLGGG